MRFSNSKLCPGAPRLGLAANPVFGRAFATKQSNKAFLFCQPNHLHLQQHSSYLAISSTGWPLRLLFPLACPPPPLYACLLRLLPSPAGARFYSPSVLSTSLVTPTPRRAIDHHGLPSRT